MLQKKSIRVEPHSLDIWLSAHDHDEAMTEKLVSNNINLLYIHIYSIICRNDI
jgi:hypothetical protein